MSASNHWRARIVNQTLTRIAEDRPQRSDMRLRLKADGRIVELRDGHEFPLAPAIPGVALAIPGVALAIPALAIPEVAVAIPAVATADPAIVVKNLRRRACLTQLDFAARLGVPVETIRNWEQGKRMPRGPARALLAVIAHAPETAFAALART